MAKYTSYANTAPIATDVIGLSRSPYSAGTFFSATFEQIKEFVSPAQTSQQIIFGTGAGISSSANLKWTGTDLNVNGTLTLAPLTTAGILHNTASGLTTSSLIVNADIDAAAGIVDTKLSTISTAGKVSNSATTATAANTASTIVSRDVGGNFNAGTITATLNGNASTATSATTATTATNFTGLLSGDITGTQGATLIASNAVTTSKIINSAVTNAKLDNMATMTFKGNNTGGAAPPLDLTVSQMQTALGIAGTTLTSTQIAFGSGTNTVTSSSNLIWNDTNKVLSLAGGSEINLGQVIRKRSLVFYNNTNNDFQYYGIGIDSSNHMRFQANSVVNNFVFAIGSSTTTDTIVSSISGAGVLTLPAMSTAGVVHNNASGTFLSSLIVAADITNSTITGAKIASSTVANSNLSNMNALTIKGNNTGSSSAPLDLTVSQAQAMLGSLNATLTLNHIGYGGSGNLLTGSSSLTYDPATTTLSMNNGSDVLRISVNSQKNKKISLLDAGLTNEFQFDGFGVSPSNDMTYNLYDSSLSHIFYSPIDSTSRQELFRIQGDKTCLTQSGGGIKFGNATASYTAGLLDYYEESVSTAVNVIGPWASKTSTMKFSRIGKWVMLEFAAVASTTITNPSQPISFSLVSGGSSSVIPARFRPSQDYLLDVQVYNGTTSNSRTGGSIEVRSATGFIFITPDETANFASTWAGYLAGCVMYLAA